MLGHAHQDDVNREDSMMPSRPLRVSSATDNSPWSMATSPHLAGKLRDALGADAGTELVLNLDKAMNDVRELRADVAELRHEMQVGFDRLQQSISSLRADMKGEFAAELGRTTVHLSDKIAAVKTDLMKWSFVFWIGAVTSIALLAGVLRG